MYSVSVFNPIFSPPAVMPASNKIELSAVPVYSPDTKELETAGCIFFFLNRTAKKKVFRQEHLSVHWGSLAWLSMSSSEMTAFRYQINVTLNGIQKVSAIYHDHRATWKTHG